MGVRLSHRKTAGAMLAAILASGGTFGAFASDTTAGAATLPPVPTTAQAALSPTYSIPSNAVFVSTSGRDTGTGAAGSPLRTIAKAIAATPTGGTVVVRAGTYREGSSSLVTKNITLQNYPGEEVWMDGTDVVSSWTQNGNAWATDWSTPSFCANKYYNTAYLSQNSDNSGPCTHIDMAKDPSNPAAGDPQMAFVNGTALKEVTSLASVGAGNFFYDQDSKKLYIGSNPSGATVELAARPNALALQGGSGFNIKGVGFKRYATNEFNGNSTHGAIMVNEPNVTFDHVAFTQQAGAGLAYANPIGSKVSNSYFGNNGFNGLDANGHYRTGTHDGLVIESSMFDSNNTELFGTGCGLSCASAGSKMAHMNGVTIKGNIFQNNKGAAHGYWCDVACSNTVIVDNVFKNNGGDGVFYEVSDTGTIASNLIEDNHSYGIKMGSANTNIYNNTIANNGTNALIYDDNRTLNVGGWTDVGPDTKNVNFYNNILAGGTSGMDMQFWRTSAIAPNTGPNTFITGLDYNTYFRPSGSPATLVDWKDGTETRLTSLASLNAKGFENSGLEASSDPTTSAAAAKATSPSIKVVPADIALAIGVNSIGVRGAVLYPGSQPVSPTTTTAKPTTTTTKPTTTTAKPVTTTTAKPTTMTAKPTAQTIPTPANTQGFESATTDWNAFGYANLSVASDKKHSGSHSLRIESTSDSKIVGATEDPLTIKSTVAGQTYAGSCWVKSHSKIDVQVRFEEYGTNWVRAADPVDGNAVNTSNPTYWYKVSVKYTAQTSGEMLPFTVYSTQLKAGGEPLYVDDCSVSVA